MEIFNHWLTGQGVTYMPCPKNRERMEGPEMIVLHYTAGSSAAGSAFYLTRPDVKASAHVVIGRRGEVFQLVPFNVQAWHAGESRYKGRSGLNRWSVGIELDNLGRLRKEGERFVADCGVEVPAADVYTHEDGSHWHRYTERQVAVLQEVCRLLGRAYPIRDVVGHSDVTERKQDPGPALPF